MKSNLKSHPKLLQSQKAFLNWKETDYSHRADLLMKLSTELLNNKKDYATLITKEMGKPLAEAIAEIEKCASCCEYYAKNGESFLKDEIVNTEAHKTFVSFRPLGIVLAVMPWNFPFWQVIRFAAPAVMAGNAPVLKHASNVPKCSKAIEKAFLNAGFPKHLFTSLIISAKQAQKLIEDPLVKAVTLTGSTPAGKAVAQKAGQYLKKCVLELGGSDAFVVLEDADLEKAATVAVKSRTSNAGQSCIAAKRFIVVKNILNEFQNLLLKKMTALTYGDPLTPVNLGPMAREDLRNELHMQVQKSLKKGAKLILGGAVPKNKGAFYPPTILVNVKPGTPAYDEELFGPVASVIVAKDETDALRIANDTTFGLGATVFTKNLEKGEHIAKFQLDAGSCFVNAMVKSDPRVPFGGTKQSGYGRELSAFGIREFVNIKTVWIES